MAKAYWIAFYRSIKDPDALAAYAKLAGPALQQAGGRFLARGLPAKVYELGLQQRTVLIEFDSVAQAVAATARGTRRRAARAADPALEYECGRHRGRALTRQSDPERDGEQA